MKPQINFKKIKKGYRGYLMKAIDDLLDYYGEDYFDEGYQSCLADMSVRAQRLAEKLHKEANKRGNLAKDKNDEYIAYFDVDETAQVIEDYFNKALTKK